MARAPIPTRVRVRVLSCDAKIVGSLVGGCRVTIRNRETDELLAAGLQLGGSGDTERILQLALGRFDTRFDTPGTAVFEAEIPLSEPTPVSIEVEGPVAYPASLQKASITTWLIPGEHVLGDGFVLKLFGFIVEVLRPFSVDVFRSNARIALEAGVRLL